MSELILMSMLWTYRTSRWTRRGLQIISRSSVGCEIHQRSGERLIGITSKTKRMYICQQRKNNMKNQLCLYLIPSLFAPGPAYLHWLWWAKPRRIFNHRTATWTSHSPQVRACEPRETSHRGNCCGGYWRREVGVTTVNRGRGGRGTRKWRPGMSE